MCSTALLKVNLRHGLTLAEKLITFGLREDATLLLSYHPSTLLNTNLKPKRTTSRQRGWKTIQDNSNLLDYDHIRKLEAKKLGFSSYTDYLNFQARQLGFKSFNRYLKARRKKHGFLREVEYQKSLASKRGLESLSQYQTALSKARRTRLRNRRLSHLMKMRMQKLNLTLDQLSEMTGIQPRSLWGYRDGRNIPRRNRLLKILRALGVADITDEV
jgi:hypothetical protein